MGGCLAVGKGHSSDRLVLESTCRSHSVYGGTLHDITVLFEHWILPVDVLQFNSDCRSQTWVLPILLSHEATVVP